MLLDPLLLFIFPAAMVFAAISDALTMTIPNRLSLGLIIGFIVMALLAHMPLANIGAHFAAASLVLAISFGFFAAGWMGGGDAKLAAATALWIGLSDLVGYALLASVFGGLLTLGILWLRKYPLPLPLIKVEWISRLHYHKTGIPYGIALAIAGLMLYTESPIWRLVSTQVS